MASRAPPEEQPKLLEEAMQVVKVQAFQMKRCLDKTKLMDALKHASTMLAELRTSNLSPKNYYELYIAVVDELRHFELFLREEYESTDKVIELYELVQYAGNIVPRLYLMITVGTVYVQSKPHKRKEILMDLVEMSRGVQHPLRGLFLRNYLLQITKSYLPDSVEPAEEGSGDVRDSIEYILLNFAEMNKLWVRMQHQGHSRDREKRERERKDLRILVGTNLVRLSQLENIDADLYAKVVLPGIMEQVVNCRDTIAQEYLMECIIQVFPDEFHLKTLHMILEGCAVLQPTVNVKNILNALIDRLALYAAREDAVIPEDVQLFDIFSAHVSDVVKARPSMAPSDIVALQVSLTNLALKCFPDKNDYVDKMIDFCAQVLSARNITNVDTDAACSKELMRLAKIPVDHYPSILTVLDLPNYAQLWNLFGYENRKTMSKYVVNKLLTTGEEIDDPEYVGLLMDLISPLITDQEDQPTPTERAQHDNEDFVSEQKLVAALTHQIRSDTRDLQYQLLVCTRKHFGVGGDVRIKYTLPPLVYSALKLAAQYAEAREEDEMWERKAQKLYQYAHQTTSALAKADYPTVSLRLFLDSAAAAGELNFEPIAYEFMTRALLVYEEEISGSVEQTQALTLLIGTLERSRCFSDENFDTLATKLALHSARLLKKPDQCRMVASCSHLFWSGKTLESGGEERHEGKRVLECLQKSLKIADSVMDTGVNVALFEELLEKYLFYMMAGNEMIQTKYIVGLVDLIQGNLEALEHDSREQLERQFKNIMHFIRAEKEKGENPMFAEIEV